MSDSSRANATGDERLEEVLADYLQRVDNGEEVDRDQFVAEHTEVAEGLLSYFETADRVDQMAGPVSGDQPGQPPAELASQETILPSQADDSVPAKNAAVGDLPEKFGRYEVKKCLGQGAMGSVYLAHDSQLQRDVALKVPKFGPDDDADLMERFYREARSAATLSHPHICPVHDVGEIEGTHFIAMAFVEGHPLSDYIRPEAPPPVRNSCIIIRKLALALAEAHSSGVVHRDLKPANIMVDKRNDPIVMDFGLARQIDKTENTRMTQSGMLIGTPSFMSPEQVNGDLDLVGPPSDIFSLGVIFYEMLAGQLPFRGSLAATLAQILKDEPAPVSKHRAEVDAPLEAICRKMLAKNIEDRYVSMQEVADELAQYLKKGTSQAAEEFQDTPAPEGNEQAAEPSQDDESEVTESVALKSMPGEVGDALKKLKARKQKVESLLTAHKYGEALKLLKKMAALKNPKLSEYTRWAKKQIPKAKAGPERIKQEAGTVLRLAQRLVDDHDYGQAHRILDQYPVEYRTQEMEELLDEAIELDDEVGILEARLTTAQETQQYEGLLPDVMRLLELKPKHKRGRELHEELSAPGRSRRIHVGRAKGGGGQLIPGWMIGWALMICTVTGALTWGALHFYWQLGDGRIHIEIDSSIADSDLEIFVDGDEMTIENLGETIKLKPGEHTLQIRRGDRVISASTFSVLKGDNPVLKISLDDGGIVVRDRGESDSSNSEITPASAGAPPPAIAPFNEARAKAHQQAWADYLGQPVETTNSIGMKFVVIPPGEFKMGFDLVVADVTLTQPFHFGIHAVTQNQWKAIMGTEPWKGQENVIEGDNIPATYISWINATEFCQKLTEQERAAGRLSADVSYRLPTDAEWEHACRAGTNTMYTFGEVPAPLGDYAWYDENAMKVGEAYPHAVGLKKPNAWDLFDVHGNVWGIVFRLAWERVARRCRSHWPFDRLASCHAGWELGLQCLALPVGVPWQLVRVQ